jgi:uncharacterized protein YndB with AHSA1/START domain
MSNADAVVAEVRRRLPASPEAVFDEWLDPGALSEWMCPRPARCLKVETQPWVGGRVRFDIEDSGRVFFVTGRYLTIDRPRRLAFTWSCSTWADPAVESVVTVTLRPHGDRQTLMTIEHALLPPEVVERHAHGWILIAGQLDAALAATTR